jgi:predicted aldo/keto reductase-like oxidoreductase
MQYRKDAKSGNNLSILGLGCMRFPSTLGRINMEKSEEIIVKAIESGINYFDTAYMYAGSEEATGEILHKNGLREKIYIATKLPHHKCKSYDDFDKIFNEQLKRLKTDYIDYYLIHNIADVGTWQRLIDLGIDKWIAEKKANEQIHRIGFSFHGTQKGFTELIDAYDWEFCQIQYNYMNEHYQAGITGLHKIAEKGLPAIVMEPLLGGRLANGLPKAAEETFNAAGANISYAAWGLRWLWNQPEVTVVLSGMSLMEQLLDNLETAQDAKPAMLTAKDLAVIDDVAQTFKNAYKVSCTGCNYCMPCPQGVNIPGCFAAYNLSFVIGFVSGMTQYVTSTVANNSSNNYRASQCIQCGKCEKLCPQNIAITSELENVKKRMEPFWFNFLMKIISKVMS